MQLPFPVPHFVRHHWLSIAFIGGLVSDLLLLNRIDDVFDNLVLIFYVLVATVSLVIFYASIAERFGERWSRRFYFLTQLSLPYALGGLFSGMLIFYGRSGDIIASWPFLTLIVLAIVGNELIRERGRRLVFNILAYFVGIFSYCVLVIPVFTGLMGLWVFIGSGLLALAIVYGVIRILSKVIPNYMQMEMRLVVFAVFGTFIMMNALYIMNLIPPIPLSLKEIAIVNSVIHFPAKNEYELKYEPIPWWNLLAQTRPTLHPVSGSGVSCFTSVSAPSKINTEIYHQWDFYDEAAGHWTERFRLSYPITGAAVNGYRGHTTIQNFQDGLWRCSVKNDRGQLLGHKKFYIDTSRKPASLETRIE